MAKVRKESAFTHHQVERLAYVSKQEHLSETEIAWRVLDAYLARDDLTYIPHPNLPRRSAYSSRFIYKEWGFLGLSCNQGRRVSIAQKGFGVNNFATSLIKLAVLAGGAVIGTLVARWLEEAITSRAEERSEHDKTRYAQGLAPLQRNVEAEGEK